MSVGRPRWTSPPTSSIVCWTWDARAMSASPDPDRVGVSATAPMIRAPRWVLLKLVQTRRFDLPDLVQDKAQARHVAPQLGQVIGREGRPFRKPQSTQALW